ncbi:precorrin-3B C(17)-methyltransferase [Halorhodospira abdelmalekii]|uniref:precorrin-3B C(17)-methyltransferase n=1 Tax=Halorhodospira abdelmalekii TaxID=421629 RepID=UPI001906E12B|nr:precorrin-3B C(17)-methyltransferase [Halorhodospira abdelmalekii]MBK1734469.1 precorrin-3B C(17)-methyltransferase [Halorhodospira abdelmalekii]
MSSHLNPPCADYDHDTPPAVRVVVGVGCDRGAAQTTLEQTIRIALADAGLDFAAVAALATITLKQDEPALNALAAEQGWPLVCYSAAELAAIPVPHPSATVARYTGTPAVAEAAALRFADTDSRALLIEKRRRRGGDGKNVTVAVALLHEPGQAPLKDGGKISVVGIGPGDRSLLCPRAEQAIRSAEIVVGYKTYLAIIADLITTQQVISRGMTEELERAEQAYAHAAQGKRVALISSGDAGVYGMAAPIYELLMERGHAVAVEVIPGVTALSASASLVGAPLSHDFCAVSLSDLLTPWPVIARRLASAGRGDFVVALYNPASRKRTRHIVAAQQILLRYRHPQTPVAIVRAAYREGQRSELTTLAALHESELDMLSTVLIGNSATYQQAGCMITPRGYRTKYNQHGQQDQHGQNSEYGELVERDGRGGRGEQQAPPSRSATTQTTPVKRGQSLPLGLEGWHAEVRAWLRSHHDPNIEAATQLEAAMHHFDVPWAEIVTAVEERLTDADDPFSSRPIAPHDLAAVLTEHCRSPRLSATTATPEGVLLQLEVDPDRVRLEGGRLTLAAAQSQLVIDTQRITDGFLLRRPGGLSSLELCDLHGDLLLRLTPQSASEIDNQHSNDSDSDSTGDSDGGHGNNRNRLG